MTTTHRDRQARRLVDELHSFTLRDIDGHELPVVKELRLPGQTPATGRYASIAGIALLGSGTHTCGTSRQPTRRSFLRGLAGGAMASLPLVGQEMQFKIDAANKTISFRDRTGTSYEYEAPYDPAKEIKDMIPQMVRRFGDYPHNSRTTPWPTPPDSQVYRDGLRHLITMNGTEATRFSFGVGMTYRWRKIPIPYHIPDEDKLVPEDVRSVIEAARMWEKCGLSLFEKVDYNPRDRGEDGLLVRYYKGGASYAEVADERLRYPKNGEVRYPDAFAGSPFNVGGLAHEFGHALEFGRGPPSAHSDYYEDMMFRNRKSSILPVELRCVFVLYTWPNNTITDYFVAG